MRCAAQVAHGADRGRPTASPRIGTRQHADAVAAGRERPPGPKRGSAASRVLELREVAAHGAPPPGRRSRPGTGSAPGTALERDVALLGRHVRGQRRHAALRRCGGRRSATAAASIAATPSREAERAAGGDAVDDPPPEAALDARPPGRGSGRGSGRAARSTRSPNSASSAGSSVSAAATETMPTMIAPAARLRMIVVGTSSMPSSATTNVLPLKSTARLAVAPACGSRPPSRARAPAPRGSGRRRTASSRSRARGPCR